MGSNKIYLNRGDRRYPDAVEEGQLNPMQMHSYNKETMKLTHTHVNAYPQFTDFNDGVWKAYEKKIFNYAKTRCSSNSPSSNFYVITGVSDYEIKGNGRTAVVSAPTYWPVAYEGAETQPLGSEPLQKNVESIVQPKSMWTVGCCTWKEGKTERAEAVSVWANNKPKGFSKSETQPYLDVLARRLFPANPCFSFFPGSAQCANSSNHFTMA